MNLKPRENYNHQMQFKTEELQKQAESSRNDSSINGAKREFDNQQAAAEFFAHLKSKIFDLEAWNSEGALSKYAMFDESGREITNKPLAENDFIRLSLKGSGKYDWVRVMRIHQTPSEIVISVKPTFDPTSDDQDSISHFFTSEATNNFCLLKNDKTVMFYVIGLDEKTNTDETGSLLEKARNFAAANVGSYFGVQSAEWTKFCRSFLEIEEGKTD